MKTMNKQKWMMMGLASLLALGQPAYALEGAWGKEGGYGKKDKGRYHEKKKVMMDEIVRDIGVTDDQKAKIDAHREQMKTRNEKAWKEMAEKREALRGELEKPEVDTAKIDSLIGEISALHAQKTRNHVDGILEVRSILTPEQYTEMQAKMQGKKKEWKEVMREHKKGERPSRASR